MVTSLGFHTMELSLKLTPDEAEQLLEVFEKSRDVYFDKNSGQYIYQHNILSKYYTVRYIRQYAGMSWTVRCSKDTPDYMIPATPCEFLDEPKCCTVKARINPKILLEEFDYIVAANSSCLDRLIEVFNREAAKLSPLLGDFKSYSLTRIDYCLNFDLADLMIDCDPDRYMMLIRQADIPHYFKEYKEYRGTTHRKRPGLDSFYLMNDSVHINCYFKYRQLVKEFSEAPNLEEASNIVRFEIQCLPPKTYYLQRQIREYSDNLEKIIPIMLSDEKCEEIITKYYCKTIGLGDYYSLDEARKKIQSRDFHQNKEERLMNALELVNTHRGISKAKAHLSVHPLVEFKRSVKDLHEIGINPVTIPREWRIKYLPNLLTAYLARKEKFEKEEAFHTSNCR